MGDDSRNSNDQLDEIGRLRSRLNEAEQLLGAIRSGDIDALVVSCPEGDQVVVLTGIERTYRVIVETMNEAALMVGLDETILFCNQSFCSLVKTPLPETIGRNLTSFAEPAEQQNLRALLADVHGGPIKRRLALRAAGGAAVPVQVGASLLMTDAHTSICMVVTDLTELESQAASIRLLREQQQALEESRRMLEAANRELDAFSYSVSHDLRAPLRAMSGLSEALLEDFGEQMEGEARIFLNEIIAGARRMGKLIDGLLTLSRTTRGELRRDRVDLTAMAERIRVELERSEPRRRVEWRIEPGLSARGDARMIEVVMRNLLGNAWKYTAGRAEPIIRVYAEPEGNELFFCVADNGAGFDMAHAGKLFQPFQRLHRQDEFPGIGIGLATVQRIVHRHGGTIQATGEPRKGATFRFSLADGGSNSGVEAEG